MSLPPGGAGLVVLVVYLRQRGSQQSLERLEVQVRSMVAGVTEGSSPQPIDGDQNLQPQATQHITTLLHSSPYHV